MPTMTYGEIWQYQRDILNFIKHATGDAREGVRHRAKKLLPAAAQVLIWQGTLDEDVGTLEQVLDELLDGDFELDANDVASAIWRAKENLQRIVEVRPDQAPYLDRLVQARQRLEAAPYSVRLRWLVGGWSFLDEAGDDAHSRIELQTLRIEELARDACAEPSPLDQDAIEWLVSGKAQRAGEFWTHLGKHDVLRWWAPQVSEIARRERTASVFKAIYLAGDGRTRPAHRLGSRHKLF